MHQCPGPGCTADVPYEMLMCRSHWYRVPRPIRSAVWRTWQDGRGAGTPEHTAAITAAVRSIGG